MFSDDANDNPTSGFGLDLDAMVAAMKITGRKASDPVPGLQRQNGNNKNSIPKIEGGMK